MSTINSLMVELIAVLKESLRRQAFSVILLLFGLLGMWCIWRDDRAELLQEIANLKLDIKSCATAREMQSEEIAELKVSIARLESKQ